MNLKTRIATFATAAFISVGAVGGAVAQDNTVTQEIGKNTEGALTASIADATFEKVDFKFDDQNNPGALTLTVKDERGTFEGWNVTIQAGDFKGEDAIIPASGYIATTFNAPTPKIENASIDSLATGTDGSALDSATMALSAPAGHGSGEYTQSIDTTLTIPGQTPAGTYVSELTVSIASGPASNQTAG